MTPLYVQVGYCSLFCPVHVSDGHQKFQKYNNNLNKAFKAFCCFIDI